MQEPKISIITVSYNSVKTIEETITCVLSQHYDNLEYIIIDGGSTDGTLDIIDHYRNQIAVVVSEKDRGISDAFNKGIARATGDIIGISNSDDKLLPGALRRLAAEYDGKTDIYCGNIILWNDQTDYKCREVPSTRFPVMPFLCHVAHQGMFITRKAYQKYGNYDTSVRYIMDLDFMMRAYRMGAVFHYIDQDMAVYRGGGITSDRLYKKRRDYIYVVRKNGGNYLQAYFFFAYLYGIRFMKIVMNMLGPDFSQKLRYHSVKGKKKACLQDSYESSIPQPQSQVCSRAVDSREKTIDN